MCVTDTGKHEDDKSVLPTNQKTSPITNTPTTTIPITTTSTTTTTVVNDASGSGKSVTVRGSQPFNNTTGKDYYCYNIYNCMIQTDITRMYNYLGSSK